MAARTTRWIRPPRVPPLMRPRVAPVLVALVVVVASTMGLLMRPPSTSPRPTVFYVIVLGAPGLRWDDLSPEQTPTMWELAQRGAIGALSVRSAHRPTCPEDGWVTLGAGNYAQRTSGPTPQECPPPSAQIERPDGIGAHLPDQSTVVPFNDKLPWGAVPGALAESVRCTTAIGPGAAIAAARPFGRVDRYASALPADSTAALAACRLNLIDLGTVSGDTPAEREVGARQADATLAQVLAARPERALVIVAGLSDTDQTSRLHVAIADGPGWSGGWLTSASTGRPGYLALVDLAPTALAALAEPLPRQLIAGHAAERVADRPADLQAAVARLADADQEAGAQRRVATSFFTVLAIAQIALFLLAVPLLRRARQQGAGRRTRKPWPPRVIRAGEILLTASALAIPAALLADAVPWWRSSRPGLVFAAVTLAGLAAATTAVVVAGPARRRPLGPLIAVAAIAVTVVGLDLLTGARLQLNGVAGYSALEGGRYAGVGIVGLGTFLAGLLVVAGCLAQRVPLRWRRTLVAFAGAIGVLLVGSPYLGADAGGAVALTAGVCIAAALSTGGWLTFGRLGWGMLAGLAVTTAFALLDLRRPVDERGSLGRFLTLLSEGAGGSVVHRAGAANVIAFGTSPLTLLALTGGLFLWFALLRDWGGLKRLFGLYPAVRAGFAGVAVASVIAGVSNEAALNVAGAAAATVLPLATLAALRVLGHADDRTLAADPAGAGGPARPDGASGSEIPTARAATDPGEAEPGKVKPGKVKPGEVNDGGEVTDAGTDAPTPGPDPLVGVDGAASGDGAAGTGAGTTTT